MLLESKRRCGIETLQGVLWTQPGLLQLVLTVPISGVVLMTKAEELSKEMGSNSVGHLEIELLKLPALKQTSMQ